MTPERAARLVSLWVRIYTRGLRAPTADRRVREIESDLHDQITHDRATGARERAIAVGILGRMIRGAVADVRWRGASGRPLHRSPLAVLLATALVLSVPAVAMLFTGEVRWGATDFVMAGLLLGGTGLLAQRALISWRGTVYGLAATVGLMAALLLVWACLAVGVVGAEDDPANLMCVA